LFSPLQDEIIDQKLEEQDVDTIKIMYDHDWCLCNVNC